MPTNNEPARVGADVSSFLALSGANPLAHCLALAFALALAAAVGACVTPSDATSIIVGESDDGRRVALAPGQTLEARLPTRLARGFVLSLGSEVAPTLRLDGRPKHRDGSEQPVDGELGNVEIWRFVAEQPGEVTLRLDYRRQWNLTGEPTRSIVYGVVVR